MLERTNNETERMPEPARAKQSGVCEDEEDGNYFYNSLRGAHIMAAEAAKRLDYLDSAYYGSAAPAQAPYVRPGFRPEDIPVQQEQTGVRERAKENTAQRAPSVSLFAVFGAIFAGFLMFFVVLAQISYNEVASETVRLNAQLSELTEQERRLEIEFESVIDIKEVERYARDTLGMSKPDAGQVAVIGSMSFDSVEIFDGGNEDASTSDIGSFISSLLGYLKR